MRDVFEVVGIGKTFEEAAWSMSMLDLVADTDLTVLPHLIDLPVYAMR